MIRGDNDYDIAAAGYDSRHNDPRSTRRFLRIERQMRKVLSDAENVLDLGCGTGRLAPINGKNYLGLDASFPMLQLAQQKFSTHRWVHGDAHHLPFANGAFDAVIAAKGVVRYLNFSTTLREIHRILRPGGAWVFHCYPRTTWARRKPALSEELWYPDGLSSLRRELAPAHFAVKKVELFRSIRVAPYVIPVPRWLPGQWASHLVVHCTKVENTPIEPSFNSSY